MRLGLATVLTMMLLAGCVTAEGPPQILNAKGVVARPAGSNTASLIGRFDQAAKNAFEEQRRIATTNINQTRTRTITTTRSSTTPGPSSTETITNEDGQPVTRTSTSVTTDTDVATREEATAVREPPPLRASVSKPAIDEFLDSGFALVYANCNDYFTVMGQYQTGSRIARDFIAPVVTVLTGLVSAGVFEDWGTDDNLLRGLTLGSALATSGLDIYEAHFLFGVENIDSVRELIFRALGEHREKVVGLNITNPYQVAIHLIDHQAICVPAHILALAREAIAEGRVEGRITDGTAGRADLDWRRALGAALGIEGPLTTPQAYALWRLFETTNPDPAKLYGQLTGLPSNPIKKEGTAEAPTYALTNPWPPQALVLVRLTEIPSTTRETYRRQVTAESNQNIQYFGRMAQAPELLPPNVEEEASGYQRVRIGIADAPN